MSYLYTELIADSVPFDITTQQIYDSLNDQLDNGILTISEETQTTRRGPRKNFKVCAECRRHNPLFNKMDVRERLIIYIDQNGKNKRLRFNVVIH
jgi:hypothetical protein